MNRSPNASSQLLVGALALASLLPASSALAGGFSAARFGAEYAHPAGDHPTAIYYNPAGLSLGSGTRVYGEGLFVLRVASYDRPFAAIDHVVSPDAGTTGTPADATNVNAGAAKLTNFLVSPFLGAASDFGIENFGAGIAVFAPFGGQSSWKKNDSLGANDNSMYPGAVDGVQRWQNIEGQLRVIYLSAAASYYIPSAKLSIGASVSLVKSAIETLRARNAAGTDDVLSSAGSVLEGRSLVNVSSLDLAVGAGAIVQPIDGLYLGLSYQSAPGFKDQRLEGTLTNKFGSGATDVSDIFFEQSMPDVIRAGLRYRLDPTLELRLQGDMHRWSKLRNQCLVGAGATEPCKINSDGSLASDSTADVIVNFRREWKDTYGVRAGASWWSSPELEIGGSLAYDSNAVPDETMDPALMDMDKLIGSAMVRYQLNQQVTLTGGLLHVYYAKRTVDARSRDGAGEAQAFEAPSRSPDGAGNYKNSVSALTLGAEYAF